MRCSQWSVEEFKKIVTAEQPEAPEYFLHDAILNRQDRGNLHESIQDSLNPLDLDEVLAKQVAGAQILDTRETADFAGGHLEGSLNISLDGKYATWCGTVLDKNKPIIVIAEAGREEEAIVRLGRIGFDLVAGYLEHGVTSLESRPELIAVINRTTARDLAEKLESDEPPVVIDVRSEKEWAENRIRFSVNVPLNQLAERIDELPVDERLIIHCGTGYRSSIAASILQHLGINGAFDLVGGLKAWEASSLPTVRGIGNSKTRGTDSHRENCNNVVA